MEIFNTIYIITVSIILLLIIHFILLILTKSNSDNSNHNNEENHDSELKKSRIQLKHLKENLQNLVSTQEITVNDMKSDLVDHLNNLDINEGGDGITRVVMKPKTTNVKNLHGSNSELLNNKQISGIERFFRESNIEQNNYNFIPAQIDESHKKKLIENSDSIYNNNQWTYNKESCLNGGVFFGNIKANDNTNYDFANFD